MAKSQENSHVGVQLEVSSLVSKGKVVLGQFGLGRVKGHLVAGQPALVAQHCSSMDDGALEVHITAQVHVVALVARLQLSTLLPEKYSIRPMRVKLLHGVRCLFITMNIHTVLSRFSRTHNPTDTNTHCSTKCGFIRH